MNPCSGWWLPVTTARDVSTKALFGTRLWRLQNRMLHHVPDKSVYIHNMPSTTRSSKSGNPSLTVPKPPLDAPALEDKELCFSYEIARGEMGVLSFEPYKSLILPYWAFRTVPIAQNSAEVLWEIFRSYVERGDLVGADMTRKFIQMGMTRAKRYANHKGGRYVYSFTSDMIVRADADALLFPLFLLVAVGNMDRMARYSTNGREMIKMESAERNRKRRTCSSRIGGDAQKMRRMLR